MENQCICDKSYPSSKCRKAKNMTNDQKQVLIKRESCFKYLKIYHISIPYKAVCNCTICRKFVVIFSVKITKNLQLQVCLVLRIMHLISECYIWTGMNHCIIVSVRFITDSHCGVKRKGKIMDSASQRSHTLKGITKNFAY